MHTYINMNILFYLNHIYDIIIIDTIYFLKRFYIRRIYFYYLIHFLFIHRLHIIVSMCVYIYIYCDSLYIYLNRICYVQIIALTLSCALISAPDSKSNFAISLHLRKLANIRAVFWSYKRRDMRHIKLDNYSGRSSSHILICYIAHLLFFYLYPNNLFIDIKIILHRKAHNTSAAGNACVNDSAYLILDIHIGTSLHK